MSKLIKSQETTDNFAVNIIKLFKDHKVYVEPFVGNGEIFFAKEASPSEIINDIDIENQYFYKMTSLLTKSEIVKIEKKENLTDILKNVDGLLEKNSVKTNDLGSICKRLNGVRIYTSDYSEVVEKHDMSDTLMFLNPPELEGDEQSRYFETVANIEKAGWIMALNPEGEMAESAMELSSELEYKTGIVKNESGRLMLVVSNYDFEEIETEKDWEIKKINSLPKVQIRENVKKTDFTKIDFGGVDSLWDIPELIRSSLREAYLSGKLFDSNLAINSYYIPYIWVCDIRNDYVIFDVEDIQGFYKILWDIENGKIIYTGTPEKVTLVELYLTENEKAVIVPKESEIVPEIDKPVEKSKVKENVKPVEKSNIKEIAVKFIKADESERYILGIALEPNDGESGANLDPDTQGDVYSFEDVRKAEQSWLLNSREFGIMHSESAGDALELADCYIQPVDITIGTETIARGSWMIGAFVKNDNLWEAIQSGEFSGWSIAGSGIREEY